MSFYESFKKKLFSITPETFEEHSLELFEYQYRTNPVYSTYCKGLDRTPANVHSLELIPHLPIDFFKQERISSESWPADKVFYSSGTTGIQRSMHYIRDMHFYQHVSKKCFELIYGELSTFQILALLPSYQEQENSSLLAMVDHFLNYSTEGSGYYLNDNQLLTTLQSEANKLLLGVSYALLDLIETQKTPIHRGIVMETGGMKGRRKEMIRNELHQSLIEGFGVSEVHSEYGMTELTSQAYSKKNGLFRLPVWSRVLIRDTNDPLTYLENGITGGINIIDLANISSCAFVETMDLGRKTDEGEFEVMGRFDNSDIRGCNLLIT